MCPVLITFWSKSVNLRRSFNHHFLKMYLTMKHMILTSPRLRWCCPGMCKILKRFDNCEISHGLAKFCQILDSNKFHVDIQYHNSPLATHNTMTSSNGSIPRYWPFVRGMHWSPVNSPHKGQWREALMFSLICVWTNSWANNGDVGDLRCHRAHYDVIVMDRRYTDSECTK